MPPYIQTDPLPAEHVNIWSVRTDSLSWNQGQPTMTSQSHALMGWYYRFTLGTHYHETFGASGARRAPHGRFLKSGLTLA
jgi:hypothetical protein